MSYGSREKDISMQVRSANEADGGAGNRRKLRRSKQLMRNVGILMGMLALYFMRQQRQTWTSVQAWLNCQAVKATTLLAQRADCSMYPAQVHRQPGIKTTYAPHILAWSHIHCDASNMVETWRQAKRRTKQRIYFRCARV